MFDKIVCLNIYERICEQGRIKSEFKNVGLNIEFFVAHHISPLLTNCDYIDIEPPPNRQGYPAWVNRPNSYNAFCCFKKIIQKAKEENRESVTLVEDDASIGDNFLEILNKVKKELLELPTYNMLYMCANHTWTPTKQISEHILKLNGSGGFQCVNIKNNMFQHFLDLPLTAPIDEMASKTFHKKYNCYAVWPNIIKIIPMFSSCEGIYYDNTNLYKNKGC